MASGKVFVSYSHREEDKKIAEAIVLQLRSKISPNRIFFDQVDISEGDKWEKLIEREVPDTRVALFLMSPDFLASEFIKKERRMLLEARERDPSVSIHWVCLKSVEVPREFLDYQGFCKDIPFTALDEARRQRTLEAIASKIAGEINQEADLHEEFTDRVRRMVRYNFDMRLDRSRRNGDHSIVYKAVSDEGEFAVKARVARSFERHHSDANAELQKHLDDCRVLSEVNPTFIPLKGGLVQGDLQILISQFVRQHKTLSTVLSERGAAGEKGLPPDVARFITGQLAAALASYHEVVQRPYGVIRPSDILLIDEDHWHVRIPSFRMAIVEFEQSKDTDKIMLTNEVLSYLAYEQHDALELTYQTDQCSLGLLAIELLEGAPPVKVRAIKDMSKARSFFKKAAEARPAWDRLSGETAAVLQKMVHRDPDQRHASMARAVEALGVLDTLDEDNRRIAKRSYSDFEDITHDVIAPFYEAFFKDPEIRAMFAHERFDEREQHRKLERALLYLLNFRESDGKAEPTTLTHVRAQHDAMPISLSHYEYFETCLLAAIKGAGDRAHTQRSEEVEIAWRATVKPGLDYMSAKLGPR